jgi:hypothetical protein
MTEEVVQMARKRPAIPSSPVHPEVVLGEAQEQLEHAYTFGTDADIAQAQEAVERARASVGGDLLKRHANLIRETASTLADAHGGDSRQSPLELAVTGLISFPALLTAWEQNPGSLALRPDEAALVKRDRRNLRLVVLARQEQRPLGEVAKELDVHDVSLYALAARGEGNIDEQALSEWLTEYLWESGRDPDS